MWHKVSRNGHQYSRKHIAARNLVATSSLWSLIVSLGNIYASLPLRELTGSLLAYARSDDGSLKDDNPVARYSRLLNDAMIASGRVASSEESVRERLEKAGFVDVQSFTLPLIVGPWAKEKYDY
jgi:hypothetical protein